MDPVKLVAGLFKKPWPPITPEEISKRAVKLETYAEWSRCKRLLVFNPPFWGFHDLFIDENLNHALVSLKESGEAFVFTGDVKGARGIRKYSPGPVFDSQEAIGPGMLEWIVYDDFVVYHGPFLPLSRSPYYVGKVAAHFPFHGNISEKWELEVIPDLLEWYKTHDRKS